MVFKATRYLGLISSFASWFLQATSMFAMNGADSFWHHRWLMPPFILCVFWLLVPPRCPVPIFYLQQINAKTWCSVPDHFLFRHCGWLRDLVPFCPGQIMMAVVLPTDLVNLGIQAVFYMVATLVQTYSKWPCFYMVCQYLLIDHSGLMFHHNQLQQVG